MIFQQTPTVIGHRGSGSGDVPVAGGGTVAENTLPSLLAAAEAGLSWVEIDVTRTSDDTLVLRHDPTTPDGGFIVERDAAASGLPRLEEVFAELPTDIALDLDIKTVLEDAVDAPSRRTGALLAPLLRREAKRRPLVVTSFDPSLLVYLRDEVPEVPAGLLTWLRFPMWHGVSAAAGLGLQAVALHTASCGFEHPDTRLRSLEHNVDVAHKAGLDFMVWCPKAADAARYAEAGVDAMVVNEIPGVLTALA
ncbi:glycerophosphodiester phosphodiesterase [Actinomadura atramentaria]|uniref:glycerophosphodiester phosphodiesterase n=1 Tax=Actinomadura atramentaria TaxID=1990 RepID=UPI00035C5E9C|nr:glycerophosphodiester phosphodiesterase [Actinomadura atramentaria]